MSSITKYKKYILLNIKYILDVKDETPINPCQPSPCGPNSQCREVNKQAVCSCLPNYIGNPPGCRPECTVSSECPQNKACIEQKCSDPCPGVCGLNADCQVINHSPICSCRSQFTGDPFTRCHPIPRKPFQKSVIESICNFLSFQLYHLFMLVILTKIHACLLRVVQTVNVGTSVVLHLVHA